jgi:hypothetical protein
MNRGIWIALALLVAAPAHAQDDTKKPPAAGKAATTAKTKKAKPDEKKKGAAAGGPTAGGSSAWGTGGASKSSVASKQSATASPAAVDRAAMLRARAVYRYAVESCAQGGKTCDAVMRDDAESKFIDSCLPCATREQCEAERDIIRAGNAKTTTALCAQ